MSRMPYGRRKRENSRVGRLGKTALKRQKRQQSRAAKSVVRVRADGRGCWSELLVEMVGRSCWSGLLVEPAKSRLSVEVVEDLAGKGALGNGREQRRDLGCKNFGLQNRK